MIHVGDGSRCIIYIYGAPTFLNTARLQIRSNTVTLTKSPKATVYRSCTIQINWNCNQNQVSQLRKLSIIRRGMCHIIQIMQSKLDKTDGGWDDNGCRRQSCQIESTAAWLLENPDRPCLYACMIFTAFKVKLKWIKNQSAIILLLYINKWRLLRCFGSKGFH